MLDKIMKAIGLGGAAGQTPKKEAATTGHSTELLASVLLLEAAHADFDCSDQELEHVVSTIASMYSLEPAHVQELLEFAHSERKEAVGIYPFVKGINSTAGREEKLAILEAVWRIILIDGQIDKHEEHFARKLTNMLHLEHRDFIEAKLKVREEGK